MYKTLLLTFVITLTSCTSYNDPSDYEMSNTVLVEKNGNKLIRCFSHINAFVDKKDWYYAKVYDGNLEYCKLQNIDEQKLLVLWHAYIQSQK